LPTPHPHVAAKTETVHPSWQAKKSAQAKALDVPAFKGKKIVFDD
jgi:hypothetical protein